MKRSKSLARMASSQILSEKVKQSCGCINNIDGTIEFCSLHESAKELLNSSLNVILAYNGADMSLREAIVALERLIRTIKE